MNLKNCLILSLFGFFPFSYSKAAPIIIDHNHRTITSIPEAQIVATNDNLHIAYGHTSHGSQLTYGMNGLVAFMNAKGATNNLYAWNNGGTNGALDLHDGAMAGDVGYFPQWVDNTRAYLGTPDVTTGRGTGVNADVNVIIWSWCGQASGLTEAQMITNYLEPMNTLEEDYPGIKFVYMTGHLDGGGLTGNLHLRNEQIREYCRNNDKILYDFEDIESYDPDGVYYGDKIPNDNCDYDSDANGSRDRNWAIEWQNSHTLNVDWYDCGAAHSQSLNANLKAYAAWWLWARLAGWEGIVAVSPRSDVDGSSAISTTDALLTLRNSLGLAMNGTAWQASATTGDVNCDGNSNSTDALLILRHSLGLSMSGTNWCEG